MQNLSGTRVLQYQQIGMQRLSPEGGQRRLALRAELACLGFEVRAIDEIAQQRMADMGEVDPDLVGPAGLELAGQQRGDRLAVAAVEGLADLDNG